MLKAFGTGDSSDKMDPGGEVRGAFPRARLLVLTLY